MRAERAAFPCVGIQYTRKTRKIPIGARRKIGDLVHLISPSDARIRHCPNAIASPSETAMPPVLGLRARQVVIFTLNTLSVDADFREIWTGPYRGREGGQNSTPGSGKSHQHQSPRVDDVDDAKRSRAIILRPFPPAASTSTNPCICNWPECGQLRKVFKDKNHPHFSGARGRCVEVKLSTTRDTVNFIRAACRNLHVPSDVKSSLLAEVNSSTQSGN